MSWKSEVEDLVGTVTDNDAISTWLKNGAWDVINKVKQTNPSIIHQFSKLSENIGDSEVIGNNDVVSVFRTDSGTESEYREILPILKYKANNANSIYKASESDPVYYRENGTIYMLPTGGNNDLVIVSIDTNNLAHGGEPSETDYFPDEMKHLLVLYVCMQELQRKMSDTLVPSDVLINMDNISKPVMPITFTGSSNMSTWDASSESRLIVDETILSAVPTYISPVMSPPDFADTDNWIKEEEDPEMLAARIQEIGAKVQVYSAAVQDALNKFNEDSTEYQATLQIAIKNAELSSSSDSILMQRFATEIQKYQGEVQSKVQEYTLKSQGRSLEYQWLQDKYLRLKQQYEQGFVPFAPPKQEKN